MATNSWRHSLVLRPVSKWKWISPQRESLRPYLSARALQTTAQFVEPETPVTLPQTESQPAAPPKTQDAASLFPRDSLTHVPTAPQRQPTPAVPALTPSLRANLPHLLAQPPYYATLHIHGKPYLVTEGDRVRLPFLMHGVVPGDVLRLDRATHIGSRDWTLVGGTPRTSTAPDSSQPATTVEPIVGPTHEVAGAHEAPSAQPSKKKKGPPAYLDARLFVARAVVLGSESEPMRVMKKTKRRQRHVKYVKSKHRYTILRIMQIAPRSVEEVEALGAGETA